MMTKEEYKRELIRMWDTHRDEGRRGYERCHGVKCEECPLYPLNTAFCENSVNAFEIIEEVEKWSKEHPPKKYKVSKLEYDILESIVKTISSGLYFFECDSLLMSLLEKGYFEGATLGTDVKEYFKNCEVDCELGGNENVKRRKV